MRAMHAISLAAFENAFLYQRISFDSMLCQYRPLLEQLDPTLVWLAERHGGEACHR